jgi:hypothetical protein
MPEYVDTFARNAAGNLIINPRKIDVQSFWLTPDAPANPINLAAAAGAASGPVTFSVSQDGPFEAFYLVHDRQVTATPNVQSAQDCFVDIYDEGAKLRLVNRAVHIDTLFGRKLTAPPAAGVLQAGVLPHLLAETLWVHATRSLVMQFVNGAAAVAQTIWPIVVGRRFYGYANPSAEMAQTVEKRSARARLTTPFWMVPDNADPTLLASATGVAFIRTPTVGHFEWHKLMVLSTGAFRFQVTDSRNGRRITNDWVHVNAGTGAGPVPLVLPEPILFQPNTQVRLDFVDLSVAPNTIYFTLAGRMIYVG